MQERKEEYAIFARIDFGGEAGARWAKVGGGMTTSGEDIELVFSCIPSNAARIVLKKRNEGRSG